MRTAALLLGAACASGPREATRPPEGERCASAAPAQAGGVDAGVVERGLVDAGGGQGTGDAGEAAGAMEGNCPRGQSVLPIWTGAPARESNEGHQRENVTFKSDGDRATLEIGRDGLLDDSIAATQERYELRWEAPRGWVVVSRSAGVVRCYRGVVREGKCP